MEYNFISAFEYEIKNHLNLKIESFGYMEPKMIGYDEYQNYVNVKKYLEDRIAEMKVSLRKWEDKIINGIR